MRILSIETSCDDTGVALLDISHTKEKFRIAVFKNLVASQKEHAKWGGVVPNIARNGHIKNLPILFKKIGKEKYDAIAVTVGPGLEPALWAGIEFAKKLSKELRVPLIGVNHLEGHLYSFLLSQKTGNMQYECGIKNIFPAISLIVSGGNTILVKMDSITKWNVLGETQDDAAGEALDKAARTLGLSYPGGPAIERLAHKGNPRAIAFPRPMIYHKNYDFSFAGLKTALFYYVRDIKKGVRVLQNKKRENAVALYLDIGQRVSRADIASSFQEAVVDVLARKTARAVKEYRAQSLFLSGGVAANTVLRKRLGDVSRETKAKLFVASHAFNTDNAAMIAVAGYMSTLNRKKYAIKADADLHL